MIFQLVARRLLCGRYGVPGDCHDVSRCSSMIQGGRKVVASWLLRRLSWLPTLVGWEGLVGGTVVC